MTICEFYKNQFDEAKATSKYFAEDSRHLVEDLGYKYGSFKWLKAMAKKYFGGGYEFRYEEAGITLDQLKAAREAGYIKYYLFPRLDVSPTAPARLVGAYNQRTESSAQGL